VLGKLFTLSNKTSGLIPKIEKVARFISFLVLALDTLRFFKKGLEALEDEKPTEKAPAPAPAGGRVVPLTPSEEDEG
jgi:hypothetical protein